MTNKIKHKKLTIIKKKRREDGSTYTIKESVTGMSLQEAVDAVKSK